MVRKFNLSDYLISFLADEARELKRMREIPETINIIDGPPNPNENTDDVIFDDRHHDVDSSDADEGLPHHLGNHKDGNDSLSEEESDEDDEDNIYNPNRMPKKTGNLNANNLIGSKKDSGKGARNDRREAISGSDSDAIDELAHI